MVNTLNSSTPRVGRPDDTKFTMCATPNQRLVLVLHPTEVSRETGIALLFAALDRVPDFGPVAQVDIVADEAWMDRITGSLDCDFPFSIRLIEATAVDPAEPRNAA